MKQNDDFAYYLSKFFQSYLNGIRNVSENTIHSYRDTFTKLLVYYRDNCGITPEKMSFSVFTRGHIENFLFNLESKQKCSISTRNQRLAAIKSFCRYVQIERPDLLMQCQSIMSLQNKKCPKPVISYLTVNEMQLLFSQPDTTTQKGRRDLALLSLMYDSAARVQEVCDLKVSDVRLMDSSILRLYGKGRKVREVPLEKPCAEILRRYMEENGLMRKTVLEMPLFYNKQMKKLSRSGVSYVLEKYIDKMNADSVIIPKKITPHCLRHSKAMHMLEAGINLIYIRDYLGHESIETTQVYARANPEAKRKAIKKMELSSPSPALPDWNDDPDLMKFLHSL